MIECFSRYYAVCDACGERLDYSPEQRPHILARLKNDKWLVIEDHTVCPRCVKLADAVNAVCNVTPLLASAEHRLSIKIEGGAM